MIRITKNEVIPYINKIVRRLKNTQAALKKLGILEVSQTKLRFKKGVEPNGKPWKPSKRALRTNGQTLVKTGELRRSISFEVQGNQLFIGTDLKYGKVHQKGSSKKNIPRRRFLGINDQTRTNARNIFQKYLGK